tara:strand:+ start:386 stop:652 length:267 start_codon:yes stop_codon:yes gene_type:complete
MERIGLTNIVEKYKAEYLEKIAQLKDDQEVLTYLVEEVAFANASCVCLKSDQEELKKLILDMSRKHKTHIDEVNKHFKIDGSKKKSWF